MEQNNRKDPEKLQTLLNSLTAYNRKFLQPNERWKIRDEYSTFKDENGKPIVTKERVAYVKDVLAYQYKLLVARRNMIQQPIDSRILDICVNFLTDPTTRTSLLFYGTTGTGKTTFMRSMYMTVGFLYQDEIRSNTLISRYIKASELGSVLKSDKDDYKRLRAATCLFIDDLGFNGESEVVNDYGVKARPIEDIIEHRYDRQLLTVCTTNLTGGEIRDKYGERIYSRMCETFSMVAVTGQDFRQSR
jgi:DNA replication protein DnaC